MRSLTAGFLRQIVLPEHPDVPRIPADQIQNQLDGGAFPRAVGAHQPVMVPGAMDSEMSES